jgi:hypothetical protein
MYLQEVLCISRRKVVWGSGKKPNFQPRGKSQQARQQSAQRAEQQRSRKRTDETSPHMDGNKSARNPKRR